MPVDVYSVFHAVSHYLKTPEACSTMLVFGKSPGAVWPIVFARFRWWYSIVTNYVPSPTVKSSVPGITWYHHRHHLYLYQAHAHSP